MTLALKIIIGIVVLIVLWLVLTFNRLITLRARTKEAWADIDVQLKRRYNLIPNLIETVKGYTTHEKEVFQRVTEARTKACLLYTSPSPRDRTRSRMPSSA